MEEAKYLMIVGRQAVQIALLWERIEALQAENKRLATAAPPPGAPKRKERAPETPLK